MTSKEKAIELVEKFKDYVDGTEWSVHATLKNSKICAVISVDEILSTLDETVEYCLTDYELPIMRGYWLLVKLEIEKL